MAAIVVLALESFEPRVHAELPVIYDSGHTRPLAEYLDPPEADRTPEPPAQPPSEVEWLAEVLPIVTPELTPGPVTPLAVSLPYLSRPLFLLGSDALSKRWLTQYRERLGKLQAVGMLIQADTAADIAAIRAMAADLSILPTSGSELARQLKLTHYPVLISATRIEQ